MKIVHLFLCAERREQMSVNDRKALTEKLLEHYDPKTDKFTEKYQTLCELRKQALHESDWETLGEFAKKDLVQEFAKAT